MILRRFNLNDIENCKTAKDVFNMMGIAVVKGDDQDLRLDDKKVFGEKAYYANMVMNNDTFNKIYDQLKEKSEGGGRFDVEAFQWANFAPLTNGPKYDKIKEETGDVSEDVLYIITPEDSLFEQAPAD